MDVVSGGWLEVVGSSGGVEVVSGGGSLDVVSGGGTLLVVGSSGGKLEVVGTSGGVVVSSGGCVGTVVGVGVSSPSSPPSVEEGGRGDGDSPGSEGWSVGTGGTLPGGLVDIVKLGSRDQDDVCVNWTSFGEMELG